jgi:hypothetical protein
MPASKKWVAEHGDAVVHLYRSRENLTTKQIAAVFLTREANVSAALRLFLPAEAYSALKSVKYSASKMGDKNPMRGKTGEQHHNWVGETEDGRGYLKALWHGRRTFVHHIVMMRALGILALPVWAEVHHIDEDKKNNAIDNLALVTKAGHRRIHFLQEKDSKALSSRKFKLAEALKYMT